jgi:hypothetical protein
LGGWNTGIVSYFSGRTVVNLDGVVNDQAIPYLRRRDLASYMDQRHIDYLVDGEGQIDFFMSGFGGQPDWRSRYSLVKQIESIQLMRRQER